MTDEEARALGERWRKAAPTYTYAPGMLTLDGDRVMDVIRRRPRMAGDEETSDPDTTAPPDFRDAATRGAGLDLARHLWDDPHLYIRPSNTKGVDGRVGWEAFWFVSEAQAKRVELPARTQPGGVRCWGYDSEAEILVAVVEALWEKAAVWDHLPEWAR